MPYWSLRKVLLSRGAEDVVFARVARPGVARGKREVARNAERKLTNRPAN